MARKIVGQAIESGGVRSSWRSGGQVTMVPAALCVAVSMGMHHMEEPPTRLAVPLLAALVGLFAARAELGDTDRLLKSIWQPEPLANCAPGWEPNGMALVIELGRA